MQVTLSSDIFEIPRLGHIDDDPVLRGSFDADQEMTNDTSDTVVFESVNFILIRSTQLHYSGGTWIQVMF